MNKISLNLFIIFFLLTACSFTVQAQEFLWQKKLDSPVYQVSFDNNLSVASQKEVIYFDRSGKLLKKLPLKDNQFAVLSKSTQVFAVITHRAQIKEVIEKTELFNCEGELLSTIEEKGFPFLSPDGNWLAVVDKFKNEIIFLNKEGKLLNRFQFDDIKGLNLAFSDDSSFLIVNIPNIKEGKTSGFLALFDKDGKKLWRYDHPGSTTGQVAVSQDAKIILFSSEKELYSLNNTGALNWKKPLSAGGILISLSPDSKYIALSRRQDNSISLLKSENGHLIWKQKLPGFDGYNSPFTSLNVTDEGLVVTAISKSWSLKNNESYLYFLKEKEIVSQLKFSQQKINAMIKNNNIVVISPYDFAVYKTIY